MEVRKSSGFAPCILMCYFRPAFADFVQRYKIIAFDTVNLSRVKNGMGSATKIIEAAKLENYHIGKTKLFLKFYHLEQLERSLQKYFSDVTRTQAAVRGVLARKVIHIKYVWKQKG